MGIVASAPITLSEFESLADADGKHEVDAGELIALAPAESLRSRIVRLVSKAIESYFKQHAQDGFGFKLAAERVGEFLSPLAARIRALCAEQDDGFELFVEAGYLFCAQPLTYGQPDISVISKRRVIASNTDFYFEGAPELAVEVISPSDTAGDIETKVRQHLAFGANEVWVLYPKTRTVYLLDADSKATILTGWQTLEGSPTLPGFRIRVEQFFAV